MYNSVPDGLSGAPTHRLGLRTKLIKYFNFFTFPQTKKFHLPLALLTGTVVYVAIGAAIFKYLEQDAPNLKYEKQLAAFMEHFQGKKVQIED